MKISLTSEDLAKGTLVSPGWYPCRVTKYEEVPANTDRSTNCIAYLSILTGEFKGSGTKHQIANEKAMGFAKNFMLALGAKMVDDGKGGKKLEGELNKQTVENKLLDVYFARGTSNKGNEFNDAKDFAPIGLNTNYKP